MVFDSAFLREFKSFQGIGFASAQLSYQDELYRQVTPSRKISSLRGRLVKTMSKDLGLIFQGWDHNPNEVTVRRITGLDGRSKIQMRLDLGVLQMEMSGRPDGKRPHGYESLLEYYEDRLRHYSALNGDSEGFELDGDACGELKQESMQYYYRYLSLFHLSSYNEVIRDTERNLRVFDFLREHAEHDDDRLTLDQFRPYVLMMNTRAKACLALESQEFDHALGQIDDGVLRIEDFFLGLERSDLIENCREISFLRDWSDRIRNDRPLSPAEKLRRELQGAVEVEDYERAAMLRDQIRALSTPGASSSSTGALAMS